MVELYPTLQLDTYKSATAFEAESQALTQEPLRVTAAEQQAVEDAPRRSLGTSISTAVKDMKDHLHFKDAASTGRQESQPAAAFLTWSFVTPMR